jgi:hypothetical protein
MPASLNIRLPQHDAEALNVTPPPAAAPKKRERADFRPVVVGC